MEKLIELLNEYNCKVLKYTDKWKEKSGKLILKIDDNHSRGFNSDLYVISKKFGFIKWLVENEKIDLEKVERKFYNEICITDYGDRDRACGKSDLIISVLSIQDEPIEFLCSLLK